MNGTGPTRPTGPSDHSRTPPDITLSYAPASPVPPSDRPWSFAGAWITFMTSGVGLVWLVLAMLRWGTPQSIDLCVGLPAGAVGAGLAFWVGRGLMLSGLLPLPAWTRTTRDVAALILSCIAALIAGILGAHPDAAATGWPTLLLTAAGGPLGLLSRLSPNSTPYTDPPDEGD